MSAREDGVDRLGDLFGPGHSRGVPLAVSISCHQVFLSAESGTVLTASNAGCGIPVLLTGPTVRPGANCGLLPLTRSNKLLPLLPLLPLGPPPPAGPSYLALCGCLSPPALPLPPSS